MPVAVDIPIHVLADAEALVADRRALPDAVAATAARQLARAVRTPRLDGSHALVEPATVTWLGPGVGDLAPELRARIAAEVAAGVEAAVTRAGMGRPSGEESAPPAVARRWLRVPTGEWAGVAAEALERMGAAPVRGMVGVLLQHGEELLAGVLSYPGPLAHNADITSVPLIPLTVADAAGGPAPVTRRRGPAACDPLAGEPFLEDLGTAAAPIGALVAEIAERLGIPPCEHAGRFSVEAAGALGRRAVDVGQWAASQPMSTLAGEGSSAEPRQARDLRALAEVAPLLERLATLVGRAVATRAELIDGPGHGDGPGWMGDLYRAFTPTLEWALGRIFTASCQIVFARLLAESRVAIDVRLASLERTAGQSAPGYAQLVESTILPELVRLGDMHHARDLLIRAKDRLGRFRPGLTEGIVRSYIPELRLADASPTPERHPATWAEASAEVLASLAPAPAPVAPARTDHAQLLGTVDGTFLIIDRSGRLWSLERLERLIPLQRGVIEEVEPIVKQIEDLPAWLERVTAPGASPRDELARLLSEMRAENERQAALAGAEPLYGASAGRSSGRLRVRLDGGPIGSLPGLPRRLGTLHAEAAAIAAPAAGPHYPRAIDLYLGTAEGARDLVSFATSTGLTVLAVACPPLAIVAAGIGLGLAVREYQVAEERRRRYRALIDPERVATFADIEAELFAAKLGLALAGVGVVLSLIAPLRAALGGVRGAGGSATAAAAAARELMVTHLVKELAEDVVIERVAQIALSPVIAAVEREARLSGSTGGVRGALETILSEAERREDRR